MKRLQIIMDKPVYLGLSILEIRKIVMYEFWYDNALPKHGEKAKLCYMDLDSFLVYMETQDIDVDIDKDAEEIFDT